jgi:thioredoxin-like negative regulator of GroEL
MGTQMMILPVKKVPDVARKLRLRNFPSVVLFKDGKKVKVWKADFDGNLDLTTDQVRKAINWHSVVLKGY